MKTTFASALLCAAFLAAAHAARPLPVGDERQVFIDRRFIAESEGVSLTVHRPEKTHDLALTCDRPWELRFGQYHSVLKDRQTYHMWYTFYCKTEDPNAPLRSIAYARSADGIRWEKPDLGLVEVSGTRNNNVVLGRGFAGIKGATHGCMVFLDPKAPPSERFRLVSNPQELGKTLQIFSSPDGIHWKLTHRDIMKFRSQGHHLDSQNVIFYDERLGRYVAYVRKNLRPPGSQGRSVARAESADLSHFPDVDDCSPVLSFDQDDPYSSDSDEKARIQIVDFYTNGVVKYPRARDAYYMFPSLYFHYGDFLTEFRRGRPVNAGSLDTRFAASRDGIHWNRYDRRPFVDLGTADRWDSRSIYMAYGVLPGADETEMYMYYCGSNTLHGWDRDDQHRLPNKRILTRAGGAPENEMDAISRLVLRTDGFVSAAADYTGGWFKTPPLAFDGDRLLLNLDTSAAGVLRVEILDEDDRPIPGYTLDDCDHIFTANEINRLVKWNGSSDVGPLAGRPVRLRFVMRDTDLYAFQFSRKSP